MTASRRPGRIVAISPEDIFARGPDDQLLNVHSEPAPSPKPTIGRSLGGQLAGDPAAVTTTGGGHVFARGRGSHLLHWVLGPNGQVTGPFDHGWRVAHDPVAVAVPGGGVEIYARGANDELVRWRLTEQGHPVPGAQSLGGSVVATPASVLRRGSVPDVFALAAGGTINWYGAVAKLDGADFVDWRRIGAGATGAPMAISWSQLRLDVLAPGAAPSETFLLHWGFDASKGTHTEPVPGSAPEDPSADRLIVRGTWFGPDHAALGEVEVLACAAALEPDHARVFARDTAGQLVHWHWDGGFFTGDVGWFGPDMITPAVASAPGALKGKPAWAYAWEGEGHSLFRYVQQDDGSWQRTEMSVNWPVGQDDPPAREFPVKFDLLVSRPADLLRIGIGWSGFTVADGDPPSLVPVPDQTPVLRLVLPPQHVAEEIVGEGAAVAGAAQFQSVQAGPSQLVLEVPADPVPLTPAGVLGAARKGRVKGDDPTAAQPNTFVELPWQLFVSPDGATLEHPVADPDPGGGAVALWRTRLRSESGDLAILNAGIEDSFAPALDAASRAMLVAQSRPARVERLELSSLGGTLRARGEWDGFNWQHEATLGRDGRVRVDVRGLLYPYGHRAVFTKITERELTDPAQPVGVLRQRTFLTVLEPTRGRPMDDAEQARAFPFDDVTIMMRRCENVRPDPSDWNSVQRPARVPDDVLAELAAAEDQLAAMPRVVEGWTGPPPPDEVAVTFDTVQIDQPQLAESRMALIERIEDLRQLAEALRELKATTIFRFFTPRVGDVWVDFPVTCRLGEQTISFTTPMIFVTDQQLPQTPTQPAFDTLVDGDVQNALARTWASVRSGRTPPAPPQQGQRVLRDDVGYAGMIKLSGQSLDLLGVAADEDRQLVNRIYVSGQPHGRGFRPRLGPADGLPGDVQQPSWALDVTLPSLRGLLPGRPETHRVLTTLSRAYLDSGPAAEVVHDIVSQAQGTINEAGKLVDEAGKALSTVHGILVDFTRDAERSGGLAAPKLAADGLSRLAGPVNVGGLTSLEPTQLLDSGATLLGFHLTDLLGELNRDELPTITTDLSGPQPVVTMAWPPNPPGTAPDDARWQELTPHGPFGPFGPVGPGLPPPSKPGMRLEARAAGTDVRTECVVRSFSLSFPTAKPLLTLRFGQVRFVQEAGRPPQLSIDDLHAEFSEDLDILTALQDKVGLAGMGPTIRVENDAIVAAYSLAVPDASSGVFVMRNLIFTASLTVPFRGDPVVVQIAFASRAKPFNLSVMMFGGGGYVDLEFTADGLRRMDVALEFGASIGVDFVIAKGEAHVLGGIRFELLPGEGDAPAQVQLVGYLRIGGSLEVLGLITATVELVLSLGYESNGNRLVGRATLVLELDLTIYSDSVELDSGEWVIAGGDPAAPTPAEQPVLDAPRDPFLDLFREHRNAFRPAPED